HTRSKRDWSSDVCSSDLGRFRGTRVPSFDHLSRFTSLVSVGSRPDLSRGSSTWSSARNSLFWRNRESALSAYKYVCNQVAARNRSEERRVGKLKNATVPV